MKKFVVLIFLLNTYFLTAQVEQGYKIGDKVSDFKLKNIDGKLISMANYPDSKGFIVIFTCNHCPFAKAYQDRILAIDADYKTKGFPVIAINPNDPNVVPEDSYTEMQVRAKEKGYTFPYLIDETQQVYKTFGATKTPHVFLLIKNKNNDLIVKYIGAIDDNSKDETLVTQKYLRSALDNLIAGKDPDPNFTKAIGCSIKEKQSL